MIKRILIADNDRVARQLLERMLIRQGYKVSIAQNSDLLVQMAQKHVPDLVLVDPVLLDLDGYEAIRQLRNNYRTACLPIIILSAKATSNDVVAGLDAGADDFIAKPFNIFELRARIARRLCHETQQFLYNSLTQIPSAFLLAQELKYRLQQPEPIAFLDISFNNFKAFNDIYSPAGGEWMIWLLADVLIEQVQAHGAYGDFISHINDDNFAVITSPDVLDNLCSAIISTMKELASGYPQSVDRRDITPHSSIISLSIGAVSNCYRIFDDYEEMSRVAAEMKQIAKQQPNILYAMDGEIGLEVSGRQQGNV